MLDVVEDGFGRIVRLRKEGGGPRLEAEEDVGGARTGQRAVQSRG